MKKPSTKKFSIIDVVTIVIQVLRTLRVTFKNVTYMSMTEDQEFSPTNEDPDPDDLVHDETENETLSSQLTFPSSSFDDVVRSLTDRLGKPTEVRKGDSPVWKYGRKDSGQLWVYRNDDERSVVDVRYYYEKV